MQHLLKTIVIMVICSATCMLASNRRIAALGGNAGFWADDDQNIYLFPQTINNLDLIQVNGAGNGIGDVSIIWGEETTWGFSFDGAGDTNANDWIRAGWGNGDMGVLFGLGMSSYDSGQTGANKESTMDLSAAWGQDMAFGELGVLFAQSSSDDGTTGDQPTSMSFGINLRKAQSVWLFSQNLIHFGYNSYKFGDASTTNMDLSADCFTTLDLSEGTNAVFSMGFGYMSSVYDSGVEDADKQESSTMVLPKVTLGVEADVTDWATVRFGMNRSYILSHTNGDAKSSGSGGFNWNFGLGFDHGSFALDMVINENVFNNPVHYITGRNDDNLTSSGASLTYIF